MTRFLSRRFMSPYERYAYRPYRVVVYTVLGAIPAWIIVSMILSIGPAVYAQAERDRAARAAPLDNLDDPAALRAVLDETAGFQRELVLMQRRLIAAVRRNPVAARGSLEEWDERFRRDLAGLRERVRPAAVAHPSAEAERITALLDDLSRSQSALVVHLGALADLAAETIPDVGRRIDERRRRAGGAPAAFPPDSGDSP